MNKPTIKNLILIGIPTIISALGIIMTSNNLNDFKNIFIFITICLLIVFICFIIYYSREERKENNKYNELQNENEELQVKIENLVSTITSIKNLLNTNSSIVTSFVSIVEPWTTNINKIANDIRRKGRANAKNLHRYMYWL